ncbi:TPA: hypothetical protein QDZ84_003958 [Shewanella algae]|uniref:hypothetical protein n=1 Tax=Shewanella algae TaxID=38313 RepID=UPI001C57C074|nr:hypothetical protein [Shewanella algae]HDS1208905.1 hypothetical protein [Shewanella algae]
MSKDIMDAMFTQQRLQVLTLGVHNGEFTDSYLYAWHESVYPFRQDRDDSVACMPHQHYANQFTISKDKVEKLAYYLDECWLESKVPTFGELETRFNSRGINPEFEKMDLILICRYLLLDKAFDKQFWDKLLDKESCPPELRITKFDRKKDIFFQ